MHRTRGWNAETVAFGMASRMPCWFRPRQEGRREGGQRMQGCEGVVRQGRRSWRKMVGERGGVGAEEGTRHRHFSCDCLGWNVEESRAGGKKRVRNRRGSSRTTERKGQGFRDGHGNGFGVNSCFSQSGLAGRGRELWRNLQFLLGKSNGGDRAALSFVCAA